MHRSRNPVVCFHLTTDHWPLTTDPAMPKIVHFEFHSSDPQRDMKFFADVFGWQFQLFEGGNHPYWLITGGDEKEPGINGGIMQSPDGQPRTINTIGVPNVDEYTAKATAHGAKICLPKMTIPGVGYVVYCTDPGGQVFGIYQHDPSAK